MSLMNPRQNITNEIDVPSVDKALRTFAKSHNLAVSISIDLEDFHYETNFNGDEIFPAASLLKLPLAMSLEERSIFGEIDLLNRHNLSEMTSRSSTNSILRGLKHTQNLTTEELICLMLISSDELATKQLRTIISDEIINGFLEKNCFHRTRLCPDDGGVSVSGTTTANESIGLLSLASNVNRYPITANSLEYSIMNSRIPIGVSDKDLPISHKTGSLYGVAHDVAQITIPGGRLLLAFLSKNQIDTVIVGYEMGLCTAEILKACHVSASSSLSVVCDLDG